MTPGPSLAAVAGPVLAAHPPKERLSLRFEDLRLDVATDNHALARGLADYYADFLDAAGEPAAVVTAVEAAPPDFALPYVVKTREPGKAAKEEYVDLEGGRVVRKLKTGLVFAFGPGCNLAVGPCLANLNQVVNFINNRAIAMALGRGALLFHAAGVALAGAGLALSGFAGAGKSTLALKLLGLGAEFVSNDRLTVARGEGGLVMTGVAKQPRVNPGTVLADASLAPVIPEAERRAFAALPAEALWDLEHKYDVSLKACYGPGRWRLSCRLAGLAVLNWRRGGGAMVVARVDLGKRPDLLPAFMKRPGLFGLLPSGLPAPEAGPRDYEELLSGTPVLEFSGGVDFTRAAAYCLDFLSEQGNKVKR